MSEKENLHTERLAWFVGATFDGNDDQSQRFIEKGIWENASDDNAYISLIRTMQPGERIAIKSSYTRKRGLPFDNKGLAISVMAIKAIGIIKENFGDGKNLTVEWQPVSPAREWYCYTYRGLVWKIQPGKWETDALIAFTFEGKEQNVAAFLEDPYWKRKFGGVVESMDGHEGYVDSQKNSEEDDDQNTSFLDYSIEDILQDGCFLEKAELENFIERLRFKKNLILQGPPGTGKTWLAKRLAYALIGGKRDAQVRAVQFHPNLSYEDFVRGWRPGSDGKLMLANGVFMDTVEQALKTPEEIFVIVIEEINRGNPAQIFGELLTLLEASKRSKENALELCYRDENLSPSTYIPQNLYVIGTMNIADRSLALVDLALRRRFAFVDLEPRIGSKWREWLVRNLNADASVVKEIERRVRNLNALIAGEPTLGRQFRVGHSYVTPEKPLTDGGTQDWFEQVVVTELGPLLDEYWYDSPSKAKEARDALLAGW